METVGKRAWGTDDARLRDLLPGALRPTAVSPWFSPMNTDVSQEAPPTTYPPNPLAGFRVAVVTEVCLYREGLASSLGRRAETQVVGTASDRAGAVVLLEGARPDVLLLDMDTPDAQLLVREAREALPGLKVVALAIEETEEMVLSCAAAGVSGYVTRNSSLDDLVDTLGSVARGELVCSRQIAGTLFRHVSENSAPGPDSALARLTPREREIAALIGDGCSNKEISRRLQIGLSTVKNHVHNLLEKLQVPRRSAAAALLRGAPPPTSRQGN